MNAPELVEQFFRHEYGKLVAVLCRQVGVEHIEAVEDAVQTALTKALENWTDAKPIENASGWLYRVARNELLGHLRNSSNRRDLLSAHATELHHAQLAGVEIESELLPGEIQDDLLRMLYVCCDDAIPRESQLVIALKTLCGFSVPEIALRLFTSEANIYQRLKRARTRLRTADIAPESLTDAKCVARVGSVHKIIYLVFTEGYFSNHPEVAIRQELCREAIRLAEILAAHPTGQTPATFALLALMHLHVSRLSSRHDGSGGLLLLEEQDRSAWDRAGIETGMMWLSRSAEGDEFSRYHAEAGIAAQHCLAPSFDQTRWDEIAKLYEMLERATPSAIHRLNRAVAVAEWQGPSGGAARARRRRAAALASRVLHVGSRALRIFTAASET